jgi:hypothetical protein
MLAKIAMLIGGGISERKVEQISMTTREMQGELSPESMGKTASSAVKRPPDAKPSSSATTGNTAKQNRLKLSRESGSSYRAGWNWKVKKEIPPHLWHSTSNDASVRSAFA